jgi:pyruvate kinase
VHVMAPENEPSHVKRAENFVEQENIFTKGDSVVITAAEPKKGHLAKGTNMVKIYAK